MFPHENMFDCKITGYPPIFGQSQVRSYAVPSGYDIHSLPWFSMALIEIDGF